MRDAQLIETTQELNQHIINLLDSLSALYGLTDISIRNLDETQLLRQALEALMSNQDMERCSIFLLDEANLLTVAAGLDWDEMLRNITRSDEANSRQTHEDKPRRKTQFRLGEGILGRAAESGGIEHCRSCADDPQFKKIDVDGEPVQGSLLCVPITCEERVLGVINVYYPEPDFFNMWHERLLLLFCKMLGRLLTSHRFVSQLDKLVDQQTQDLTKMNSSLRDEKELLKKSAVSLRESEARLKELFENLSSGVAVYQALPDGQDFIITAFNGAAERIESMHREDVIGKNVTEIFPGIVEFGLLEVFRRVWKSGVAEHFPISFYRDGRISGWRDNYVYKLPNGEIVAIYDDVTKEKQAEEQIKHLAHHDALTNLPNRALFNDRLQQALAIARRDKAHMALMFIDLDEFKPINDTYGHAVGDLLLKEVAARIQDCLRESDTVARMGGDEFTVLLPTIDAKQDASIVAEKIRHALNQPFKLAGNSLLISSSIGIAIYPENGSDEKSLLKNADIAMYYAKESGRNTVKVFPTE